MDHKNKHTIITGGAKGIGKACVELFLNQGAKVTVLDIVQLNGQFGHLSRHENLNFLHTDVSKARQVENAINTATEIFGPVDILINNAGIQRYSTVLETSEDEWDLVINTNLKSAFLCAKYALESMINQPTGVIINVSSVQAFVSQSQVAPYTTSKTAMLGLTRSIAVDYGPNIRCVAVCPGTIDTPFQREAMALSPDPDAVLRECEEMHISKRIGRPEEVAHMISYLASDKAHFITGQSFRIDGGLGVSISGSKQTV